jgi:serine/threonine-protein kinase
MTETGLSLGTPHYMSPEQATAEKEITGRSDIYSLASVMYEMLAGAPPHMGSSAQQIIMKIITEQAAPVTSLRKAVPPNVAAALAQALEKLPADRFETAKAFGEALLNRTFTSAHTADTRVLGLGSRVSGLPLVTAIGAAMLLAGLAAGFIFGNRGEDPRVVRFPFTVPAGQRLIAGLIDDAAFALSPDGRLIAAVVTDSTGTRLHLQSLDQLTGVPLPGTENASAPFFSRDGKWIGFQTRPGLLLRKVAITGGPVITLADSTSTRQSATWGDDNTIVYVGPARRLRRVGGGGGASAPVVVLGDSTSLFLWPAMLPGSKHVIAERCDVVCRQHDLVAIELATGKLTVLVPNATRGWYAPGGHLVYATQDRAIYSVRFNPASLAVSGEPIPLIEGVESTALFGARLGIAADNGTMAYQPTGGVNSARVVAVDRSGRERMIIARPAEYSNPRWAPDGKRIAIQLRATNGFSQIWVWDVAQETFAQLTRDGDNIRPAWSPKGDMLAFVGPSLMWMPADGSKPPERVLPRISDQGLAPNWSRDGKFITVDGILGGVDKGEDVYAVSVDGARELEPVVSTPGNDQLGAVSIDGKWIAYNSDESEGYKVYVRPFRAPGGRFLISTAEASQPLWVSNRELAYVDNQTLSLVVAELQLGTTVQVVKRTRLFDLRPYLRGSSSWWDYDVSRDGREFLFVRPERGTAMITPVVVVLNWTEEIKRRSKEQGGR